MHPYSLLNVATFFIFHGLFLYTNNTFKGELLLGLQLGTSATLICDIIPETSWHISIVYCMHVRSEYLQFWVKLG